MPNGLQRTIIELRCAAVAELRMNEAEYRRLYVIEDNGQEEQAATFDSFLLRTEEGNEWATELTVAAMARSLDVCIQVVSSGDAHRQPTATVVNYVDGVIHPERMITVAYNSFEGHYLAMPPKLPALQE